MMGTARTPRRIALAITCTVLVGGFGTTAGAQPAGPTKVTVAFKARVEEALKEVGLTPADFLERFPHELSGGQRQRVVLARALVGRPRLVVADEPTSMVDATLRAGIVGLIRQLRDRHGIGFLVITHDLDMAGAVAERSP